MQTQSKPAVPSEVPGLDGLRNLLGAMVWQADEWAVHFSLLSEASAPLLGLEPGTLAASEGFLKKHVHPDDWSSLLETLYRAAAEGGVQICQHRILRTDGATLWAQSSVYRGARTNGSLTLNGVTIDITSAVERERALRKAEHDSHLLVQNMRDYALFMLTLDGRVATWNAGAQRLKGHVADEVIGVHLSQLFPEEEVEKGTPEQLLAKAELERRAEYEGWLKRKGGTRFWASLTLNAVLDERGVLVGYSNIAKDLTRRRETENAIRESEAHTRLLVESVLDYGVFTLTIDGHVQTWNRGAQRLEGYRAHEIVGAPLSVFFPPDELERNRHRQLLRDAEVSGSATYDGCLVRKGGTQFSAIVTLAAVEGEDGRLRGFSTVIKDVTERRRVEDTLRQNEERLRRLIDSVQDYGFFMVSTSGHVATWSPGAERLEGYKADEIIGSSISRFFRGEEIENGTPQRLLEAATAEGRTEYEGWIVRNSGAKFWANLILSAVKDSCGHLMGFSNVMRDLTERMHAERTQAFLADVGNVLGRSLEYRQTCDAICRLLTRELARWCVLFINTAGSNEPVAVAHADPEQEPLLRSAVTRKPHDPLLAHGVSNVIETGQPEMTPDVSEASWLQRAFGIEDEKILRELRAQSYLCVPLTARGKTFGAIALVAPPGHRYSADDLRCAEEVSRRAALALDNSRLFEEAQTAIAVREQVLAVVTHDLRNPLSTIQMAATQLIESRTNGTGALKIAETIKRASERMSRLTGDLLDFSCIQSGELRLEISRHDAESLASSSVDPFKALAKDKDIRLESDVPVTGALVRCDRDRVIQVFSNLIGNALKFTSRGGSVLVRGRVDRDRIVYSVTDTGAGIPEEDLPHVFDRYWRAERRSGSSLGLGLAICKGIVESHGGSIWAESKVGRGTTFYFTLPIAIVGELVAGGTAQVSAELEAR